MKSLLGEAVFRVGGASYYWEDALLACVDGGAWATLEQQTREAIACERWQRSTGDVPTQGEVERAAADFRYDRDLVSADEMLAWLTARGLTVGEWMGVIRRRCARATAQRRPDGVGRAMTAHAPSDDDVSAVIHAELACSTVFTEAARRLAEAAAAAAQLASEREVGAIPQAERDEGPSPSGAIACSLLASLDEARLAERRAELARLDRAMAHFRERVLESPTVGDQIAQHQLEWTRVEYRALHLPSEEMAREAVLCVREDGADLAAVAGDAGLPVRAARSWVGELAAALRDPLLAARAGELLGPIAENGAFAIYHVDAKHIPTVQDPEVRQLAGEAALRRALARAVNEHVRWTMAL